MDRMHDPATLVHELASVGACVAVMLDAIACGKLTDDRPPRADMEDALARAAATVAKPTLNSCSRTTAPPQYTEAEHGAQLCQTAGCWKDNNHGGEHGLRGGVPAGTMPAPAYVGTGIKPG
jgi:hypothetical protein